MSFDSLPLAGWTLQAKDPSRQSLIDLGVRGSGVVLTTLPGDTKIAGSDLMERCDQYMSHPGTKDPVGFLGCDITVEHSLMLPKGKFRMPIGEAYVLADLHGEANGMASFHVNFVNWNSKMQDKLGWLQIQRFVGNPASPTEHAVAVCVPEFDKFYDFRHQFRLSSGPDGYCRSYVNGKLVMNDTGPTVYPADFVYFKLANYHAVRTDVPNVPQSVIHANVRVLRRCPPPGWL